MRLVRFDGGDERSRAGALVAAGGVVDLASPTIEKWLDEEPTPPTLEGLLTMPIALRSVALLPPLRPAVVIAPGPRPAPGMEARFGQHREFYLKSASTVTGPRGPVLYDSALGALSYRAQLGLVFVSTTPRHASPSEILGCLRGVTLAAELFSIDLLRVGWEGSHWHVRYGEGASFDGACPIGEAVVTPDSLDLTAITLEDSEGSHLVDVKALADFASYVSHYMQLGPRTLVLAGSPHGPVLSVQGGDPVVLFPETGGRLGPGDEIRVASPELGMSIQVRLTASGGPNA